MARKVGSLQIGALVRDYATGDVTPADVVSEVYERIESRGADPTWIALVERAAAVARAEALGADDGTRPLYGVPFAVKDNIDVTGMPTTAACPDFAYTPAVSATAVRRLEEAGAILVGKTNLDQFATGLNGTRSPYGVPENPFDARLVPGGSSSGSAVAVASGLVSFALGTDTAGSGRVPAAFTSIVGVKPSRGMVSTSGVVPACRSLDCVSIFSLTVDDGAIVLSALAAADAGDPWSRALPVVPAVATPMPLERVTVAVPSEADLAMSDDHGYATAWSRFVGELRDWGVGVVEIDMSPFSEAGALLYRGPWLAERYAGLADFVDANPESVMPVTRQILQGGARVSGAEAFAAFDRLQELRAFASRALAGADALVMPTAPTTFTVDEMLSDPIARNAVLGRFTTFVNLLDLASLALPVGMAAPSRPFGVSLHAPAGADGRLAALAVALEARLAAPLGATGATRVPRPPTPAASPVEALDIAVVGAHLAGMPLHGELVSRGATLVKSATTTPEYRLFRLPDTHPPKPGMVRVGGGGESIEVEVYRVPLASWGVVLGSVPAPLSIGIVNLSDGTSVRGYLCESIATEGAEDITAYGGWRAYADEHLP